MHRIWTPPGDVRSICGALRLAGPGAVGALGALAAWLLIVQEFDAPFLGNLIVDASSSVLSPSGFTVALDIVGQAGKALTLATTIAMQFLLFVLLWAWGTQYVQARDGWGTRWRFGLIQLGVAVALLVIAARDLRSGRRLVRVQRRGLVDLPLADRVLHDALPDGRARAGSVRRTRAARARSLRSPHRRSTTPPHARPRRARVPRDRRRCWSAVRPVAASWRWRPAWACSSRRPSSGGGSSATRPRRGCVACSWAGCRRP